MTVRIGNVVPDTFILEISLECGSMENGFCVQHSKIQKSSEYYISELLEGVEVINSLQEDENWTRTRKFILFVVN